MGVRQVAISDENLTVLLREVHTFVRRLPVNDSIRDDIISHAALLITEHTTSIEELELEAALRWVRGVTFFVARSTQRAEFRRTTTWQRLRDVYRQDDVFGEAAYDRRIACLVTMLSALGDLDRQLLIGQIWDGHTCDQLAEQHSLSVTAVQKRLSRARQACRDAVLEENLKI